MSIKVGLLVVGGIAAVGLGVSKSGLLGGSCEKGSCAVSLSGFEPTALAAPAPAKTPNAGAAARSAKVYVLAFHASWCPKCKALEPKVAEVRSALAGQPVYFGGIDRTDKDPSQAEYALSALGLGSLWAEHGKGPGFALVINAETKSVAATLTPTMTVDQMVAAVRAAVGG